MLRLFRTVVPAVVALGVPMVACNGTTGDELISFTPCASGVSGAQKPFIANFSNDGALVPYSVQLTSATMNIGAVYFDESPPSTSFDAPVCNMADIYAAQVPGGVSVNLLSTEPQEFTVYGSGSADRALSWDIWLTSGDINQPTTAPTATLTGVATLVSDPSRAFSFGAVVTINPSVASSLAGSRGMPASDPALPGAYPICKERILQIGGIDLQFYEGGTLLVTVDPRGWFAATTSINFADLAGYDDMICQLSGDDWQDAYESFGPCGSQGDCPTGQTCNQFTMNGNPSCVVPCPDGPTDCPNGYVCNNQDQNCITEYCIPDTNWAALCSGNGTNSTCTTQGAAAAAEALFLGVTEGASAYRVTYTTQSSH